MSRYEACAAHVQTAAALLDLVPEEHHVELADLVPSVAVVLWWRYRGGRASAEALAARFRVSRATAFRWLAALKSNTGAPAPSVAPRTPGSRSGSPAPMGAADGRSRVGVVR